MNMKVTGSSGIGASSGARPARGPGGEGFRVAMPEPAAAPTRTASVGAVMGVEALVALQETGGPLERKRKAVGRASRILDVLDEVKAALLGGELSVGDLDRLRRALRDERAHTDDPKLEAVLDEIELRAAVEVAKLEQARSAA